MGVDDEVINGALRLGIRHFQDGNYVKAAKLFTKAIDLIRKFGTDKRHVKLGVLLDSRAASFVQLKEYKLAGRDGEDLIELEPLSGRGYLRVSKVLVAMGKQVEAYGVAARGVKKLMEAAQGDKNVMYDALVKQRDGLRAELKRRRRYLESQKKEIICLDPLKKLPMELYTKILLSLQFRDMAKLVLVSRWWHDTITAIPELWANIELPQQISATGLKKLYSKIIVANRSRAYKRIESIRVVPRRGTHELNVLKVLADMAPIRLHGLNLALQETDFKTMMGVMVSTKMSKANFSSLQTLQLNLESMNSQFEAHLLSVLPNLVRLEITMGEYRGGSSQNDKELLAKWQEEYPLVPHLKLRQFSMICRQPRSGRAVVPFMQILCQTGYCPNLTRLVVSGFQIPSLTVAMDNLKELVLLQDPEYKAIDLLGTNLYKNLETLILREFKVVSSHPGPVVVVRFKAELRNLDLTGCRSMNWNQFLQLLQNTNCNLEQLSIGGCTQLVWRGSKFDRSTRQFVEFRDILERCPRLTHLSLDQSTNFNDYALQEMGQVAVMCFESFQLHSLDLSYNNITGAGLMDFFRSGERERREIKVGKLVCDGCDIKTETLQYLVQRGYVTEVQCELNKKWKFA